MSLYSGTTPSGLGLPHMSWDGTRVVCVQDKCPLCGSNLYFPNKSLFFPPLSPITIVTVIVSVVVLFIQMLIYPSGRNHEKYQLNKTKLRRKGKRFAEKLHKGSSGTLCVYSHPHASMPPANPIMGISSCARRLLRCLWAHLVYGNIPVLQRGKKTE